MYNLWIEIKKHCFIYGILIRNCIMSQMEYRSNFIMGIVVEIAFLFAKLLYVFLVYSSDVHIHGLRPDDILIFIGSYTMMTGFYWGLFAINFFSIAHEVRNGTLDVLISKPISLQFFLTFRRIEMGLAIPNVVGGIVMIVVGWERSGISLSLTNLVGFIFFTGIGLVVTYGLFLLPNIFSFWTIKASGINEISNAVWDFNSMPMGLYGRWFQQLGTFAIPLFLISNFSPLFVLNRLTPGLIVWSILSPILLILGLRFLWKIALRNYSSAGG